MPGFAYLGTDLLLAAVSGRPLGPEVSRYLDSVLEFAGEGSGRLSWLREHRRSSGKYPITGSALLERRAPNSGHVSEDEGLLLVLDACDELELRWIASPADEPLERRAEGPHGFTA